MERSIKLIPATSVVVTNMIGIGILITPGVLSSYCTGSSQILLVWVLGGLIAILGAVVYGQLGSLMPHSGGEFYYLSRIYHPFVGFTAGWVSLIAGFAGPIALASMAFSKYLINFNIYPFFVSQSWTGHVVEKAIASGLIIILSLFHYFRNRTALKFQIWLTILLIMFLLFISFLGMKSGRFPVFQGDQSSSAPVGKGFEMALLLSIYSYTGWNAACYFGGEVHNPKRNIPLSLLTGVVLVMILYIFVNYGLLKILGSVTISSEADYLSSLGNVISGKFGHQIISATVLIILLASINSMIFASSKIPVLNNSLSDHIKVNLKKRSDKRTLLIQTGMSLAFVLTSGLGQLLIYLTVILTFYSMITSSGIFLIPWRRLKVTRLHEWSVKISAFLFCAVLLWLIINSFRMDFDASLTGICILFVGGIIFSLARIIKLKPSLTTR